MAEKLKVVEDGAEYYMVTVSESVTFSYPVLATDMEAAREKVAALIEAGRRPAPPPPGASRTRPRSARPGRGPVPPRGDRGRRRRGVRGPEL